MSSEGLIGLLGVALAALAFALHRLAMRSAARARLADPAPDDALRAAAVQRPDSLRPPRVLPITLVALAVAVACCLAGARPLLAGALAAIAAVLVHGVLRRQVEARALRLEEQLAEAIHLATAALRAGASPTEALERATREALPPLRAHLDALVSRLRLGEDPQRALAELSERVPLHSFRLFATALGVQWSAGGSLQGSLQAVARASAERSELARRIDTQQAPTRSSVVAIVAANAAIAGLAWTSNPLNLEHFLASTTGSALLAATLWLQALALWWMARLTARRA
jgi:Flp pilus assembly protein TadB